MGLLTSIEIRDNATLNEGIEKSLTEEFRNRGLYLTSVSSTLAKERNDLLGLTELDISLNGDLYQLK